MYFSRKNITHTWILSLILGKEAAHAIISILILSLSKSERDYRIIAANLKNMYTEDFYITESVGNNAFSYEKRKHKKLYIPSLKSIESFDELELLVENAEKITFEDYDFDDTLQTCYGLKNLYELHWKWKKVFLIDNHNHAYYFWYLARSQGIIDDGVRVYHIDAHADMRDPCEYLMKPESHDIQKVFEYTNFTLNVGNFIVPAMQEWLVSDVVQIRGEEDLRRYIWKETGLEKDRSQHSIILDLDLDFFAPEMDYIDFTLAKEVILDIASKADIITICTSPFFIDQERALKFLREIFDK